jgi:hypothetical protein
VSSESPTNNVIFRESELSTCAARARSRKAVSSYGPLGINERPCSGKSGATAQEYRWRIGGKTVYTSSLTYLRSSCSFMLFSRLEANKLMTRRNTAIRKTAFGPVQIDEQQHTHYSYR